MPKDYSIRIRVACWCGKIVTVPALPRVKPCCEEPACKALFEQAQAHQRAFDEAWKRAQRQAQRL